MKRVTVGMHEAKSTLSQLVKKARAGQDVVIASNGEPVARIVRYDDAPPERKAGRLAGRITIKPGFDTLPPGFEVFEE